MTQCVPDWELEAQPNSSHALPLTSSAAVAASAAALQSRSDHEVAELTWVDGHPSMHGLGRVRAEKSAPWSKTPSSGGTLESVVDQATGAILCPTSSHNHSRVPWHTTTSIATVMDALVPCAKRHEEVPELVGRKRGREGNCSVSGSAASQFGMDDVDVGFTTSTSPLVYSPETENTSYGRPVTAVDELDSACQSRRSQRDGICVGEEKRKGEVVRSSISTKHSRAAAVHNQSERKRRDRINERMKTLQKLVPNSSKTDKASMLDEVIDYLKQLQAQVQVMNRMSSIPQMMMPLTMQQLQMSMMAQMAQMAQMGMGMAGMTMNPLGRATSQPPTMPPQPLLHPSSFLPFVPPSFESNAGSALQPTPSVLPNDPFSAYMACQQAQKPMSLDGFNRMAVMYQQAYNQPAQLNHNSNPNE